MRSSSGTFFPVWLVSQRKEEPVSQPRGWRSPVRVVRVRFEPSRLAAACLADAYEQVVPLVQRRATHWETMAETTETEPRRSEGGSTR